MSNKLWITLFLTSVSVAQSGARAKENTAMTNKSEVIVNFKPVFAGGKLSVQYTLINKTGSGILVFDRMRNLRTGEPDPNWAFIDLSGRTAILKRAQEQTSVPLIMENIPSPYAREIPAGEIASGSFQLSGPFVLSDPYHQLTSKELYDVLTSKAEMWIGWCLKSDLKAATRPAVKFGEDSVWIPSYQDIANVQKIAKSAPTSIRLHVRAAAAQKR